jgi:hypothetical protein
MHPAGPVLPSGGGIGGIASAMVSVLLPILLLRLFRGLQNEPNS